MSTSDIIAEAGINLFDTYDIAGDHLAATNNLDSIENKMNPSPSIKPDSNDSETTNHQRMNLSIDDEDKTQSIIMDHLHSVKSLKKFFETRMVVQRSTAVAQNATNQTNQSLENSMIDHQISNQNEEDDEQRQEMMEKVLESLKRKANQSRTTTGMSNGKCKNHFQ